MHTQKIIAIVGPTASGKSALGVYLAKKLGGEVISADSRQVYRGLNIGTGKVTRREMQGVPHHLLDVASPRRQFSASDFVRLAQKAHSNILQNDRMTIVVGGTGFYVDAFLGRIVLPEVPPNPALRKQLGHKSTAQLFAMLKKVDPRRAKTIEPQHKRRLIRAIEIAKKMRSRAARGDGKTWPVPAERRRLGSAAEQCQVLWLGLNPKNINERIAKRLRARMHAGMLAEARRLHARGLSYRRMEELGLEYRYLARLLQNKISKKEFEERLEREIQKYAKRQNRWFRHNPDIRWVTSKAEALRLAKKLLSG